MRILAKNKNPNVSDTIRLTTGFALIPIKCWDVESRLEFWVWLEHIKKVYKFKDGKWSIDHYLTFSLTKI